jgi:hypothetical protein
MKSSKRTISLSAFLFLIFVITVPSWLFIGASMPSTLRSPASSTNGNITYDIGANVITVTGYSSGIPCTFTDIYNADVGGGWGQISKQGDVQFLFDCKLQIGDDSTSTYFEDTNKQIVFPDSIPSVQITITNNSIFRLGQVHNATTKYATDGCSLIFQGTGWNERNIYIKNGGKAYFYGCHLHSDAGGAGIIYYLGNNNTRFWHLVLNNIQLWSENSDTDIYKVTFFRDEYYDTALNKISGLMEDVTIYNCGGWAAIYTWWYGYTVKNLKTHNSTAYTLGADNLRDDHAYIIDSELDKWTIRWRNTCTKYIYRQYTFSLMVIYSNGTAIENANVTLSYYGQGREQVDSWLTLADGSIPEQTFSMGFYNQTGGDTLYNYNPYNLLILKEGFQPYSQNFTLSEKINWTIALQPLSDGTPTLDHGFVHVSEEDKRFLVFDDGTPFYPVGINAGWWLDEEEAQFMKTHGINLARVWMSSWHINIEHPINGGFGLGNYNESEAQKLDAILDLAEQYDFYVQLVLLTFTDFAYPYGDHWNDTENNYAPSYFEANPYNARFGGPCENPINFFTDETARSYIKQRFNYILDRWGDNPRIAIWEFWNEVDLVGWGYPPQATDEISKAWHEEMALVFWENDTHQRPLTTSCRGDIFWNQTFMSDANDIIQLHTYNQTSPVNLASQVNDYITTMHVTSNNSKPITISEYGITSGDKVEFLHNGLWSALTSGAGSSSMYWYTNHEEMSEEMWDRYQYFEIFIRNIPWPFLHINNGNAAITGATDTDVYSIQGDKFNLAWILHRTFGTVSGAQLSFPNITNGRYTLSIYDDSTGTYLNQSSLNITAGLLTINLPDFSNHIAVKLFSTIERVELAPVDPYLTSPNGTYRWLDVADQPYGSDYRDSYNYSQANVKVTFEKIRDVFNGTLIASNLKPNFGYQLKLVGTPGTDDNERIGLAGRWWQEEWTGTTWANGQNLNNKGDGSSPNPNDQTYFTRRYIQDSSSPTGYHYRYTGYLVFNYFITDSNGTTTLQFETGSSYHVLWKTTQRSNATNDGPVKTVTVRANASQSAYDTDYPSNPVSIFGEWERLPMGQMNLQQGEYNCQIILTEESFHGSGGTLAGNWAGAVTVNIMFTIY